MIEDYRTIAEVDRALARAALRRGTYRARRMETSARTQSVVIDRLLDRRLELMAGARS